MDIYSYVCYWAKSYMNGAHVMLLFEWNKWTMIVRCYVNWIFLRISMRDIQWRLSRLRVRRLCAGIIFGLKVRTLRAGNMSGLKSRRLCAGSIISGFIPSRPSADEFDKSIQLQDPTLSWQIESALHIKLARYVSCTRMRFWFELNYKYIKWCICE